MKSLNDMILELLEMGIGKNDGSVQFTDEMKKLIHSIAEKCNEIPAVKETAQQAKEYSEGLSAEDAYTDMLYKIVGAPTRLHMLMSAQMLIPVISEKLKKQEE